MFNKIASLLFASIVFLQAGAAVADTWVYVNGQDGYYVVDDRGRQVDRRHAERWRDERRDRWHGHHRRPRVIVRERDRNDEFTAGIMGFLGGMAVGSAFDNGGHIPVIRQRPERFEPRAASPRPWSPAWYRWCDERYRSFDPKFGTYVGFDGRKRFCEAG
ncbi:hypothetical protein GOB57_21530 [Sinorhizobium meliloti]|nr:hypothetical protein [Sinorhizobium meliloti]